MRRLAIAMLLLVAAAIGGAHWFVAQKILAAAPAAGSYEAASRCAQELLWLPVGWLLGPFLLFVPQTIVAWFLEPLPARYRDGQLPGRALLVLRFAGLALMMWTVLRMPSMPPECAPFYRLLLPR